MVGANSDRSRSWVEDIYWSHFQFHHFAQFLRTGFDQHLALPKTFSDNVKKKLPENVSLRGPGGIVWNTGLTTRDDTLYFMQGWQQFVKDHHLKENDFLVFKYNGESMFDVLIFDGGSFCEKPASYFVRKCGLDEHEGGALSNGKDTQISFDEHNTPSNGGGGALSKGKDTETSFEEDNVPSNAGVEFVTPEKSVHGNGVSVPLAVPSETPSEWTFNAGDESAPPEQIVDANADVIPVPSDVVTVPSDAVIVPPSDVPSLSASKRIRKLVSTVNRVQTKRRGGRPGRVSKAKQEGFDWVTEAGPASAGRSGTYEFYTSNRRPVTEHEISNANRMAQEACTNDNFCIVMRPTHVYKRFYVSLPNKWIHEHLSPQSQDVILRMVEHEWLVKYSFDNLRRNGGLTGGWKYFALDNNLEEFDVCVFKPAGRANNTLIMDVNVFRVVEQITPLSSAKPPGIRRGRKKAIRAIQV